MQEWRSQKEEEGTVVALPSFTLNEEPRRALHWGQPELVGARGGEGLGSCVCVHVHEVAATTCAPEAMSAGAGGAHGRAAEADSGSVRTGLTSSEAGHGGRVSGMRTGAL